MLSPDLDWTDELARLNSIVWSARSSILNYRMRFLPAVDAVRSYVVPRMEAGLQAIGLSARVIATLDRWTGLLQSAVLVAIQNVVTLRDPATILMRTPPIC